MLSYKSVKSERQWRGAIGLSSVQFHNLSKEFALSYEEINQVSIQEMATNLKTEFLLSSYEDCLFFTLFQLKNGLSFDCLGLLIETDSSNAHRNFNNYLTILEHTLIRLDKMPKRDFKTLEEFQEYFKQNKDIIIDATEHSTQRPKDYDAQKEVYSGKKSTYAQRTHNQ